MEQNDENTIGARIEKMLMDACNAADETITAAVDEKDPVRRMTVLTEGYRKTVQALLPDEDLERLHLAEKCGETAYHTPSVIADFVLGNPPLSSIPGGVDGTMPGPDPADETVARKSPFGILEEKHGLAMKRVSCAHWAKSVGVRKCGPGCDDQLWDVTVDKVCGFADVRRDGDILFTVRGMGSPNMTEGMAFAALIHFLNRRSLANAKRRSARIRLRAEQEAE